LNTSQLNLPLINDRNQKIPLSLSSSINNTSESIKVNVKLAGSLKHALEALDLIPDYKEDSFSTNNMDIFKKRKLYLEEKKQSEQKLISASLDEINKFNYNIIQSKGWGNYGTEKQKLEEPKIYFKPNKKELENELGKKIVNTKLPRSRIITSLMEKIN
jgi:hypothetical protein